MIKLVVFDYVEHFRLMSLLICIKYYFVTGVKMIENSTEKKIVGKFLKIMSHENQVVDTEKKS